MSPALSVNVEKRDSTKSRVNPTLPKENSDKNRKGGMKVAALIAAAGMGRRLGGKVSKQYLLINDKPVLWYTIKVFIDAEIFKEIILVVSGKDFDYCRKNIIEKYKLNKKVKLVVGGKQRQDSVYNGLKVLKKCDYVVIHDGVRPFINLKLLRETIQQARRFSACVVGFSVKDTTKIVKKGLVEKTINREDLWSIQTPQVFKYKLIWQAYDKAKKTGFYGTDDASLAEKIGCKIKVIPGLEENIKITTPQDLALAEIILLHRNLKDTPHPTLSRKGRG